VLGALLAHTQNARAISQNEVEIFQLAADQLAVAIENVRLVTQARATADQLRALIANDTQSAWQHYLKNREFSYHYTASGINSMSEPPSSNGRGLLSIPLALRGQMIGTITLNKGIGGSWTLTDRDLLERVAAQAVLALENARLLDETRQRAAREQVVGEISVRLNRSLEVDAVLQSAAREFAALPEVAEAEVILASAVLEKDSDHG
jgi:GAF domain-containing protein